MKNLSRFCQNHKKIRGITFVFLFICLVLFFTKIDYLLKLKNSSSVLSADSLASLISINDKYGAELLTPIIKNEESKAFEASLFSANIMSSPDIKEEKKEADVIVKFKGNDVWSNIVPVNLKDQSQTKEYINDIKKIGEVEIAEKNIPFSMDSLPSDYEDKEKDFFNLLETFKFLNNYHKNINVAVLDTGLDINNPILENRIIKNKKELENNKDDDNNNYIDDIYGWNFVDNNNDISDFNSHGSHISGIITINPKVKLLPIKVLGDNGESNLQSILEAFAYIRNKNIQIINLSLGTSQKSDLLSKAIQSLKKEKSIVIISAAGNQNMNKNYYPASFENILAICAMDKNNKNKYKSSNYGDWVDYCYRGENIYSTTLNNSIKSKSGTSQSAAFLSLFSSVFILFEDIENSSEIIKFLDKISFKPNSNKYSNKLGKVIDLNKIKNYIKKNIRTKIKKINPKINAKDIKNNPNKEYIESLITLGVFNNKDMFYPDTTLKRAELTKLIVEVANKNERAYEIMKYYKNENIKTTKFKDVSTSEWYAPYLITANENEIIDGYNDNTFKGANNVLKAEALKMILTGMNIINPVVSKNYKFLDVSDDVWFKNYLNYAVETGIIDNNIEFHPDKEITRAEIAKLLIIAQENIL